MLLAKKKISILWNYNYDFKLLPTFKTDKTTGATRPIFPVFGLFSMPFFFTSFCNKTWINVTTDTAHNCVCQSVFFDYTCTFIDISETKIWSITDSIGFFFFLFNFVFLVFLLVRILFSFNQASFHWFTKMFYFPVFFFLNICLRLNKLN